MVNLVKEAQESKKKIILSAMVAGLTIIAGVPMFVLAGALELQLWARILLLALGIIILCIGVGIACVLDRDAGAFL